MSIPGGQRWLDALGSREQRLTSERAILCKRESPDSCAERDKASPHGAEGFVAIKSTLMGGPDR
jgi:hypothetical protein